VKNSQLVTYKQAVSALSHNKNSAVKTSNSAHGNSTSSNHGGASSYLQPQLSAKRKEVPKPPTRLSQSKKDTPEAIPSQFVFDGGESRTDPVFPGFDEDIDEHEGTGRPGTVIIKNLKYQNNFKLQISSP